MTIMVWHARHPRMTRDMLGFIPDFLNEDDPRPAREQFNTAYAHGGGWRPFKGFKITNRGLQYPGDPPMQLLAETMLHDEVIRLYECDWVCIVQPDGSFEVCRMD